MVASGRLFANHAMARLGSGTGGSIDEGGPLRQLVLRSGAMEHERGKGRFTRPELRLAGQSDARDACCPPRAVTASSFTNATAQESRHSTSPSAPPCQPANERPANILRGGLCSGLSPGWQRHNYPRTPPSARDPNLRLGDTCKAGVTPHSCIQICPIFPGAYRACWSPARSPSATSAAPCCSLPAVSVGV